MEWWASWGDEWSTLAKLARKLLSLPPSAASAERNWSTQDFIISKRRNRLAPARAEKLVYIYSNLRSLASAEAQRRGPGITDEALERWSKSFQVRDDFKWPGHDDGAHMFDWDNDSDESRFDGMHGDEMAGDKDSEVDEEEADRQAELAAFAPFEPKDFQTKSSPGTGFEVQPCPVKLPHDLEEGGKLARWFGQPYNAWYMGAIKEVNRRRTKQENVTVEFVDETHGMTWGHFLADPKTYGADKEWIVLKEIPIEPSLATIDEMDQD